MQTDKIIFTNDCTANIFSLCFVSWKHMGNYGPPQLFAFCWIKQLLLFTTSLGLCGNFMSSIYSKSSVFPNFSCLQCILCVSNLSCLLYYASKKLQLYHSSCKYQFSSIGLEQKSVAFSTSWHLNLWSYVFFVLKY